MRNVREKQNGGWKTVDRKREGKEIKCERKQKLCNEKKSVDHYHLSEKKRGFKRRGDVK